jgi:hypothetical protein
MTFTLTIDDVSKPQHIVNALGCVAGSILAANKLNSDLSTGPQSGKLLNADNDPVGNWSLSS